MTIGQLSKRTNLPVQTIRYYESIKLIPKPRVTTSGYRLFSTDYVDKLDFIKNAKALGFTLREIKSILRIDDCSDVYELTNNKLLEAQESIKHYKQLVLKLKKLLKLCPQSGDLDKCKIIKSLNKQNKRKETKK